MKPIKLLILMVPLFVLSSCKAPNPYALQKDSPVKVSHSYYYDWTTDIKIGSTGTNIFLANLTTPKSVTVDSIYFKNMKGHLVAGRGMFYSHLVKMLSNKEGNKMLIMDDFPFDLSKRECVVSYTENGITKYFKITGVQEKEGVHYLSEPPTKL